MTLLTGVRAPRLVQCSGRVKLGPNKGLECKRTKKLPVDKSNNTRLWRCAAHRRQRG